MKVFCFHLDLWIVLFEKALENLTVKPAIKLREEILGLFKYIFLTVLQ